MKKTKKGFGLVEVVVGAAIVALVVFGIFSTYVFYLKIGMQNPMRVKASMLSEETAEVLKFVRDNSWSNISSLSLDSYYYLAFDGSSWSLTSTPTSPDPRFERRFSLSLVNRDSNGNIVSSGGTLDNGSRKALIEVSWFGREGTTTKAMDIYLMNIFNE
jgi:Tfp pilus assembly protein PilE